MPSGRRAAWRRRRFGFARRRATSRSWVLLNEAVADLVNAHTRLDISQAWGDGTAVAADGTHMDTYLDNLLAETSVRYGKPAASPTTTSRTPTSTSHRSRTPSHAARGRPSTSSRAR
ncbi:Tn3 family transposase [Streptomyces sp. NPDC007100]|uniref:Tn3 family transposase n=1 Tax=Streptomyces sp. NPDC007100 TaxID=3155602 RepID=UPI003407E2E5